MRHEPNGNRPPMRQRFRRPLPSQPGARIVGGVFGFVFFGIGVTVIIFLWSQPFDAFGSPPLFFRIFGSFIALAFVAIGGAIAVGAVAGARTHVTLDHFSDDARDGLDRKTPGPAQSQVNYACSQCGASLSQDADVSPHGDVKCNYCNCWFNIHRP